MTKKVLWTIGLVSLIVLMMPLAAALTIAPTAYGQTHVTDSDCMKLVRYPHEVHVTLGASPDTLRVPMDVSWFDTRGGSPAQITHHFYMSTTYNANFYYNSLDKFTTGGMFQPGTDSFYMDVPGVTSSSSMWVYYLVQVSYTGGSVYCSVDNSLEDPPITFYFD